MVEESTVTLAATENIFPSFSAALSAGQYVPIKYGVHE